MKRTGFTLIELLIVVAIIALLVSILVPALHIARDHAHSAVCLSHLNQWGKIWTLYLDENKGKFPSGVRVQDELNLGSWLRGDWITVLEEEWQRKPQMLMCPKAKEPLPNVSYGGPEHSYVMGQGYEDYRCSYGLNLWVYNVPRTIQYRDAKYHWKKIGNIKYPTEVPLFLGSMWRGGGPNYDRSQAYVAPQFNGQWSGYDNEMMHFAFDRHRGYNNCLFVDTSVRKAGLKGLWGLRWHEQFNVGYINTLQQYGAWTWPDWMQNLPE